MLSDAHIIIPVYNDEKYIAQSVAGLKNQTYGKITKFIFLDDGSTDDTVQALHDHTHGDDRFVIKRSERNQGNSLARIHAINLSQDIDPKAAFLFIDADDTVDPEHVGRAMRQIDETGADICLLNMAVAAEIPALEGKAEQLRQKLKPSDEIVNYITSQPSKRVNISNYTRLLEFNHYSVTKAYSGDVKKYWLHSDVVRTKPDVAMMAVFGHVGYNVTALDSSYKGYTYNIREGSVSDYGSLSPTKLKNSSNDLIGQLQGFMGNMPWNVPYPEVAKAAVAFVGRHLQEQDDLFQQLPLWDRLFKVNDIYQQFKNDARTVKFLAASFGYASVRKKAAENIIL